jgi:hypothetical protein
MERELETRTSPETSADIARQFLLDHLQEEFRDAPEVRLRRVPGRSTDHPDDGIVAKTESREYLFPTEWVLRKRMDQVAREVERIREGLGRIR